MSATQFRAGGHTETGPHRRANDAHLLVDLELGLVAVFDAGGSWSEVGGRAGPIGAEAILQVLREAPRGESDPRELIERAFRAACDALLANADDFGWCGGASVALALLRPTAVSVSWLGDAMAYRVTGDRIEALTRPHTLWNECLRRGFAPSNTSFSNVLVHSLGNQQFPEPLEVTSFAPQPGERLVLVTDGVANHVPESIILTACRSVADPTACAEAITRQAITARSRDNCTCAVVAFVTGA